MAKVIVQSLSAYTHAMLVTSEHHGFVIDEPVEDGGNDFGPTPYELLTAALGGCTAMTIQLYARRKGYPLEEVAVEVEHGRSYAKDCSDCVDDQPNVRIETLNRRIVVRGPLSDEQRDDLLRVAQRCPVHRTLEADARILDTIELVH
ncbi:MAG: OsmC family protein [Dehalococcoidia bacterium]|nr:OsmC family protein [Dehalococcoidia bacterium]